MANSSFFQQIYHVISAFELISTENLIIYNIYSISFKVYPCELESVNDFNGFKDWLHTFDLYRGKNTGSAEDDESRVVGKFKVTMIVLVDIDKSHASYCHYLLSLVFTYLLAFLALSAGPGTTYCVQLSILSVCDTKRVPSLFNV